jgi:hypothetical protein
MHKNHLLALLFSFMFGSICTKALSSTLRVPGFQQPEIWIMMQCTPNTFYEAHDAAP